MKKLFWGIMLLAVTLTFMQSVEFRNSNMQSDLDLISISSALAETTEEADPVVKFDKIKNDCVIVIEGEAGISGTWMGISYTIPITGKITLRCLQCDIDCPTGNDYLREDCTTRNCGS